MFSFIIMHSVVSGVAVLLKRFIKKKAEDAES